MTLEDNRPLRRFSLLCSPVRHLAMLRILPKVVGGVSNLLIWELAIMANAFLTDERSCGRGFTR
jgi:hypothetical protein